MSITAKINAKPTKDTGITRERAKKMYDRLGRTRVAIVELTSTDKTDDLDGPKAVSLKIGFIETPDDEEVDNFLRELAQALYRERNPQKTLTSVSEQEPTAADLIKKGADLFLVDPELPINPTDEDYIKRAAQLVITTQFGSKTMLQRKLAIDAPKAEKIINRLEKAGVVGPADGIKARDVLIAVDQLDTVLETLPTQI